MKKFSDNDLQSIYVQHVKKSASYFNRYSTIPDCPVRSWNHTWSGHDAPRVFAVLDFIEWTIKHGIHVGDELGITCSTDPELEFISYKNKTLLEYPPYDLHNDYIKLHAKFDFFIFNQTIEHLYNPFMALENIYKCVKPGGYVFTSVPTINIPHSTPIHYNGYNPMGLALLFLSTGFEVVEIGQWGNYDYIAHIFKHHGWPDVSQVGHVNEERNVAQCWILARRLPTESFNIIVVNECSK